MVIKVSEVDRNNNDYGNRAFCMANNMGPGGGGG